MPSVVIVAWPALSRVPLPKRKLPAKKADFADRAMESLRHAVKAGFKDAAQMAKDTDLDALREREDFKKLLTELEKKG